MDESILDTDILSEVLKRKDPQVLVNARQYLVEQGKFFLDLPNRPIQREFDFNPD